MREPGFDSGWANDYITTPASTARGFDQPPSWYESLLSLCAIAMKTERIKLGVAVIVMPFREPVVLAKQAVTLDRFSNGRLLLGIGLGDSREEFVSIKPRESKAHRGRMLDEGLEAVSRLLSEPESGYEGKSYAHERVIFLPRPVQDPLLVYISGHSRTTPQRIARHGHGWLVSYPSLESFRADWLVVEEAMQAQDRTMSELDVTTTWGMRLDRTREQALSNYKKSVQEKLKTSGGDCDGVFVSCTALRAMETVEHLEVELDKPVVTSNASALWAALRRVNIDGPGVPAGRLYRSAAEAGSARAA